MSAFAARAKLRPLLRELLAGRYRAEHLQRLISSARPEGTSYPALREIAHFIAHPEPRNREIFRSRIAGFALMVRHLAWRAWVAEDPTLPPPLQAIPFLTARIECMDPVDLFDGTGFRPKAAHATVKKLEGLVRFDDQARLAIRRPLTNQEDRLVRPLTGLLDTRHPFTADEIFDEFSQLCRTIAEDDISVEIANLRRPFLLYVLTVLHGSAVRLPPAEDVVLQLCVTEGTLGVQYRVRDRHKPRLLIGARVFDSGLPVADNVPADALVGRLENSVFLLNERGTLDKFE